MTLTIDASTVATAPAVVPADQVSRWVDMQAGKIVELKVARGDNVGGYVGQAFVRDNGKAWEIRSSWFIPCEG